MKRIWFTQQAPFDYMPLRAGLGLIGVDELYEWAVFNGSKAKEVILKSHQRSCKSLADITYHPELVVPKLYTTRTRPLWGEYYVVEGSRFKATPVDPEIRFRITHVAQLNLQGVVTFLPGHEFDFSWKDFPKQDLGYCAGFDVLRDELLRLNKKATLDTVFYINKIEAIK